MSSILDGHVARVKQLMGVQMSYLDAFLRLRGREETHLDDFDIMKCCCAGYIEWCAIASVAAVANLTKRKWNLTAIPFESVITEALKYAERKPVEDERRVPTLLTNSFVLNCFLERFHETSRLLNDDIEYALKTGITLLGEAQAQDIATSSEPLVAEASLSIVQDATNSTRDGAKLPPENLETLNAVIERVEQQLAAEAAEARRIAAEAAKARRIVAENAQASRKPSRLHLEEEKKQEESRRRALVDEARQRNLIMERNQTKQCGACSGSGNRNCSACGGLGYHSYNRTRPLWDGRTEYYQEKIRCSCNSGRVNCLSCHGSGRVLR